MIEIKNKTRSPVQIVVRSRKGSRQFTTLIIPGIGAGKNVRLIEEEKIVPEVLQRVEKSGLISTRYISSSEIKAKGE